MLTDSETGLDLNNAGGELQGVDILWDIPNVISVARIRYDNGTRMEFAYCRQNCDEEDFEIARSIAPSGAVPLRGYASDTLGCGHNDEFTTVCWIFH